MHRVFCLILSALHMNDVFTMSAMRRLFEKSYRMPDLEQFLTNAEELIESSNVDEPNDCNQSNRKRQIYSLTVKQIGARMKTLQQNRTDDRTDMVWSVPKTYELEEVADFNAWLVDPKTRDVPTIVPIEGIKAAHQYKFVRKSESKGNLSAVCIASRYYSSSTYAASKERDCLACDEGVPNSSPSLERRIQDDKLAGFNPFKVTDDDADWAIEDHMLSSQKYYSANQVMIDEGNSIFDHLAAEPLQVPRKPFDVDAIRDRIDLEKKFTDEIRQEWQEYLDDIDARADRQCHTCNELNKYLQKHQAQTIDKESDETDATRAERLQIDGAVREKKRQLRQHLAEDAAHHPRMNSWWRRCFPMPECSRRRGKQCDGNGSSIAHSTNASTSHDLERPESELLRVTAAHARAFQARVPQPANTNLGFIAGIRFDRNLTIKVGMLCVCRTDVRTMTQLIFELAVVTSVAGGNISVRPMEWANSGQVAEQQQIWLAVRREQLRMLHLGMRVDLSDVQNVIDRCNEGLRPTLQQLDVWQIDENVRQGIRLRQLASSSSVDDRRSVSPMTDDSTVARVVHDVSTPSRSMPPPAARTSTPQTSQTRRSGRANINRSTPVVATPVVHASPAPSKSTQSRANKIEPKSQHILLSQDDDAPGVVVKHDVWSKWKWALNEHEDALIKVLTKNDLLAWGQFNKCCSRSGTGRSTRCSLQPVFAATVRLEVTEWRKERRERWQRLGCAAGNGFVY